MKLSQREKILVQLVVVALVGVLIWAVLTRWGKEIEVIRSQAAEIQNRIEQTRSTMESLNAPRPVQASFDPDVENQRSMGIIRGLVEPTEETHLKLIQILRDGPDGYSVTVEGLFVPVMRFLSLLDISKKHFELKNAKIEKLVLDKPLEDKGVLKVQLQLVVKG